MDDNKLFVHVIWATALVFCMFICGVVFYYTYQKKMLTENGYSEQLLPGSHEVIWVKNK